MFKNAKVGDKVWDMLLDKWGTITNIELGGDTPILVKFDCDNFHNVCKYSLDGRTSRCHNNPRLFWDEIKFEIPKKPFNLEEEFNKLKCEKFCNDEKNYYVCFNYYHNKWKYDYHFSCDEFTVCFKEDNLDNFVKFLNEHKITSDQLRPLIIKKMNELYGKGEQEDEII